MREALANPRAQGLLVLAALFLCVVVAANAVLAPLVAREGEIAGARDRTQRFIASMERAEPTPPVDTTMAIHADAPAATKTIELQRLLVEEANASGLQLRQLSADNPRTMDLDLVRLTYDLDLYGDLGHFDDFLQRLASVQPAVYIDDMTIRADDGSRPDLRLNIRTQVSAYVRFTGEAP